MVVFQRVSVFPGTTISTKTESNKQQFLTHSVVTPVYPGHPGYQRLFMRSFRFRSSLYGDPGDFDLRPTSKHPAASEKNTCGTQGNPSKTLLPKNSFLEGSNRPFPFEKIKKIKDKKRRERRETESKFHLQGIRNSLHGIQNPRLSWITFKYMGLSW